jgi:hypothetical protein
MRDHSQEPLPSFRSAWTGEGARPHTVLDVPTAFAISNPTSPLFLGDVLLELAVERRFADA